MPSGTDIAEFKTLHSESAAFQSWTGEIDPVGALTHIYVKRAPDPKSKRPLALFSNFMGERTEPASDLIIERGSMEVCYEEKPDGADDEETAYEKFMTAVDAIVRDIHEASQYAGFDSEMQPQSRTIDEQRIGSGDFYAIVVTYSWGLEA